MDYCDVQQRGRIKICSTSDYKLQQANRFLRIHAKVAGASILDFLHTYLYPPVSKAGIKIAPKFVRPPCNVQRGGSINAVFSFVLRGPYLKCA